MGRTPTEQELLWCQVANGAIAGVIGVSASFPLDLVKTKFQLNKSEYNGKIKLAWKAVYAERGLRGLYGGSAINLSLIPFEKSLKLVANDYMRKYLSDSNGHVNIKSQILAGATAGIAQSVVTSPMEMLKIAGQTGIPIKTLWRQRMAGRNGFIQKMGGIYTGYCSTIIRDIPFSIIYFPAYSNIRDKMKKTDQQATFWVNFGAGLISGLIGALAVTPMDCVKTRIQKKGGIKWIEAFNQIKSEGYSQGGTIGVVKGIY
jgi:hypothetical protein